MGHPSANPILGLLIGDRHVTNKANQLVVCRNFLLGNTASTDGRYVDVVVDKFHFKVPDVVEIERWLRLYSSVEVYKSTRPCQTNIYSTKCIHLGMVQSRQRSNTCPDDNLQMNGFTDVHLWISVQCDKPSLSGSRSCRRKTTDSLLYATWKPGCLCLDQESEVCKHAGRLSA